MKENLYHVVVFGVPRSKVLSLIDRLMDEGKRVSVVRAKTKAPKSPTAHFDPKPYDGADGSKTYWSAHSKVGGGNDESR